MFSIKERVETGYFSESTKGGTLYITVTLWDVVEPDYINGVKRILDMLDHATVTDITEIAELSSRYFLLQSLDNIYDDVISIVAGLLIQNLISYESITVELNDCSLVRTYHEVKDINVLSYGENYDYS